ncbi:uncharacterized protein VSU04_000833 [Chlamydotis macqueenii]
MVQRAGRAGERPGVAGAGREAGRRAGSCPRRAEPPRAGQRAASAAGADGTTPLVLFPSHPVRPGPSARRGAVGRSEAAARSAIFQDFPCQQRGLGGCMLSAPPLNIRGSFGKGKDGNVINTTFLLLSPNILLGFPSPPQPVG